MSNNDIAAVAQQISDRAIADTEDAYNRMGSQLLEVDQHYLDGEFDRQLIKRRIMQSKVAIAQHIYYMGRDLLVLKEHSEHGEFTRDLHDLGIHERVARRYMTIALKFNTPKMQQLIKGLNSEKGVLTKLLELSAEPDEELETLIDGGTVAGLELDDIDRMSAKELRDALKKARAKHQEDREVHDQVIKQKNDHADKLAKELAKLQGKAPLERWPEFVEQYNKDLTAFSLEAFELLNQVYNIVLSPNGLETELPTDARRQIALASVERINGFASLVGEMQNAIFAEYSEFINQPIYSLSDPLTLIDEEPQS